MRYYRRKRYASKTAKKVFLRLLFVIAAAAVITGLAVLLGNHVKTKVEEADKAIQSADTAFVSQEKPSPSGYYAMEPPVDKPVSVFAVGVKNRDNADLSEQLKTIKENFDTVSVNITESGRLVYISPAMLSFARLPTDKIMAETGLESYELIKNLGAAVKAENLRICAVMEVSRSDSGLLAEADKALLSELAGFGFDEVIITGFNAVSEDIPAYFTEIANDMISIGVVFPAEVYLDEDNDKIIQRISASGVFLCVDLGMDLSETEKIDEEVRKSCTLLRNSFDSHNLRVIIHTDDAESICTEYAALMELNIDNIQITNEISYEMLAAAFPGDMPSNSASNEEEPSAETGSLVNPYVTTTVNETTADTEKQTEDEPETTDYYRSESSWY